jgi:4-hydroxy-3-methylbut-2-enyl diphosphate reductase
VRAQAAARQFTMIFDATCPLVTKVHMEVMRQSKKGHECILIGHAGHAEVEGTLGQYNNPQGGIYLVENTEDVRQLVVKDPMHLSYYSQTTLSVDETTRIIQALKIKFPHISGPKRDDICYATQNRQDAVKILAQKSEVVLVLGSHNSSNSNRLRELSEILGTPAYLIDSAQELQWSWFEGVKAIGITAGASAPDILVSEVIAKLKENFNIRHILELEGMAENMFFSMPKALRTVG